MARANRQYHVKCMEKCLENGNEFAGKLAAVRINIKRGGLRNE
jgi:hypothetical protein